MQIRHAFISGYFNMKIIIYFTILVVFKNPILK